MRSLNGMTLAACLAAAGSATTALGGSDNSTILDVTGTAFIDTEIVTFIGNDQQSADPVSVLGTITLSADDFSNISFGDLDLIDLDLMLMPAAQTSGTVDGGPFLGSAGPVGLNLSGVSLDSVIIGKKKKAPQESGIAFFDVLLDYTGNAFATYDLFGIEPMTDVQLDLAGLAPSRAFLDIFTVTSAAGELTVEADLFLETVSIPFEPGLVAINLSGPSLLRLEATGDDPGFNPADFCSIVDIAEPCGFLDLADISAFIVALNANDPLVDYDNSGLVDLTDVITFATTFNKDFGPGGPCNEAGAYYCYGYGGYAAIEFHEGNAAYAFGEHSTLTAGIAVSGAALMLGFGSFRRKHV